jgi:hypothetical protein
MAASVNKIPGNLRRLHQGEEFVRGRSLEAIEHADDLLLHLEVSEKAADIIHYFVHRDEHRDDDDLIVRLLGIRMFNCLNATLKLLLSGYYQASTLQQRDIIETFFLLDYFLTDQSLVARWRLADDKTLRSEFSPVNVRKALDARDAFTGEKRAAHYRLFSSLAGHPHPRGFQLIQLPNGEHHCGPFFDEKPFRATLSELGKNAVQAGGTFTQFFTATSRTDFQMKLAFLEAKQRWLKRFFGQEPVDSAQLDEMRAMIERLPA